MSKGYATLQDMIAAGLGADAIAEHGRPLTQYVITVATEPIGEGVPGNFVVLNVEPVGFAYKAQKFGIDMNTLLTPVELEARKTYLVNEARATREALAGAAPVPELPKGAVLAQPLGDGGVA